MSEVNMRHTVRTHLTALHGLHWQRIEDSLQSGIPDINFCYLGSEFWIEAKSVPIEKLPKHETSRVRIGLSKPQAIWLRTRKEAGGRALVLCKIGREWLLWDDHFQALHWGEPLAELRRLTVANWTGAFVPTEVLAYGNR